MKKLILKKEVIASLNNHELENVVGGTGPVCVYTGRESSRVGSCRCTSILCNTRECAKTCGDVWTCNG